MLAPLPIHGLLPQSLSVLLTRVRDALYWRRWKARRHRYLRAAFRNGEELVRSYTEKTPCPTAVLNDGTVFRHPADRTGLAGMLLEVWYDEVYTGRFYTPRPGDTVIDAGANVGAFSLLLARAAPACRVFAFEPFAENYALLEANLGAAVGATVRTYRVALAGGSAVGVMADGGRRSQDHQLTAVPTDDANPAAIRTLGFADVLALAGDEPVALFKCDIEGSENELFARADPALFRRVRRFAIEYHDLYKPGTLALLEQRLSPTHAVEVRPDPEGGYGMLYATAK